MPSLQELCSYIPSAFNTVEYYFNPDLFDLGDIESIVFKTKNKLMPQGSFQLENQLLIMPLTVEF